MDRQLWPKHNFGCNVKGSWPGFKQYGGAFGDMLNIVMLNVVQATTLVFMQREITASALGTTTLGKLGLNSGSAMFRLRRKQENVQKQTQPPLVSTYCNVENKSVSFAPDAAHDNDTAMEIDVPDQWTPKEAIQKLRDNVFDAVARVAVVTLMKIICNVLSKPGRYFLVALVCRKFDES